MSQTEHIENTHFDFEPRSSVIERASIILNAFLHGPQRLLLSELTERTGLPRSTVFRLTSQLVDVGWLERDEDQQGYRLGKTMLAVCEPYNQYGLLRETAHPALVKLHRSTRWVVHLSVLEDDGMVHFVDMVGMLADFHFPSRVGLRYPVERTAAGRAMLAAMSPLRAERILQMREQADGVNLDDLRQEIPSIKRNYGLANRTGTAAWKHVQALAAPIIGPAGPVGAISLSGFDMNARTLIPTVLAASHYISERLNPERAERARNAQAARVA